MTLTPRNSKNIHETKPIRRSLGANNMQTFEITLAEMPHRHPQREMKCKTLLFDFYEWQLIKRR
jgi:hypothetical protein